MKIMASTIVIILPLALYTSAETKTHFDMAEYWFMPSDFVSKTCNVTWGGNIIYGEHCFWAGELFNHNVLLQGDPSMTKYDIFEMDNQKIIYWGTFRGNQEGDPVTHSFDSPPRWMNRHMSIGDKLDSKFHVRVLNPQTRREENNATEVMRIELNEFHESWTIPETGVSYNNVIKFTYWYNINNPNSKEVYHVAKGKGTIHFETFNRGEPSGVRYAWVTQLEKKSINEPSVPWFNPFGGN
jgi:hypothetical protein